MGWQTHRVPSVPVENRVHFQHFLQFSDIYEAESKMTEVIALRREAQDWNAFPF